MRSLIIAAALLLASPAAAEIADPRAQDAADLFTGMCLAHPDNGTFAHATFDGHPETIKALTADDLRQAFGAAAGDGSGWVMPTPHGGQVILAYTPSLRTCSVLVRAADAESMKTAIGEAVAGFAALMTGAEVRAKPAEALTAEGVAVERLAWTIVPKDHEFAIIASIGAEPAASRQHLLTFTVVR